MIDDDIRANRRKILTGRVVFLVYIAFYSCALFIPLGYVFIAAAGYAGLVVILSSLGIWLTFLLTIIYSNTEIVCRATGAVPLEDGRFPRLSSAAEDLAIAAGRKAPHLLLIEDDAVNAFSMTSVRHRPDMVFCTEGMARELHPHEMAHLRNGDAELGSLIMPFGAINTYAYRLWSVVSGDVFSIILIGLLLPAVSFYLLGTILSLYWGFTLGERDYLADETAVEWTRYPEGLIGALCKAGERNISSRLAFLDNACFAPPGGVRGMMDFQPSIAARMENIRKETYLPPV